MITISHCAAQLSLIFTDLHLRQLKPQTPRASMQVANGAIKLLPDLLIANLFQSPC